MICLELAHQSPLEVFFDLQRCGNFLSSPEWRASSSGGEQPLPATHGSALATHRGVTRYVDLVYSAGQLRSRWEVEGDRGAVQVAVGGTRAKRVVVGRHTT